MTVATDLALNLNTALGVALMVYFLQPLVQGLRGVGMSIWYVCLGSSLGHALIRLIFAAAFGVGSGMVLN